MNRRDRRLVKDRNERELLELTLGAHCRLEGSKFAVAPSAGHLKSDFQTTNACLNEKLGHRCEILGLGEKSMKKFISGLKGLSYLQAALVLRGNEFPPVRDR